MLDRRQMFAIVTTTIVIGSVIVLAYFQVGPFESPFYWSLEVGDELLYSVNVSLSMSGYPYGYNYSDYLDLDGEQLIVRIDELPNVTGPLTGANFHTQILEVSKISCRFYDGTPIPQEFIPNIDRPLSQSILPLGNWLLIDSYYDDVFPALDFGNVDETTRYACYRGNESLYFGSRKLDSIFPNIATDKWEGWTDFDSGVPRVAIFYMAYPSCTYQIWLTVTMTYVGLL